MVGGGEEKVKHFTRMYWLNILIIVLSGWAFVSFYFTQMQFAEIIKDPEPPWELTINVLPILLGILIGSAVTIYYYAKQRRKKKSKLAALLLPPEFSEEDEREKMITAKACRSAYISMWLIIPLMAGIMTFYPLIKESVPYFPILAILVIPLVQLTAYYLSVRKDS